MLTDGSWWNSRMLLAASLAKAGRLGEARGVADKLHPDYPDLTLERMLRRMPFAHTKHTEHLADGLVHAGWQD
jgi:hypothetical protein